MKLSKDCDFCGSTESYFNDLKKYGKLTIEEEKNIGQKIKDGDECAINSLIVSNLKFVIMVAKKYKTYGIQFSDLISEGNMGLIKAAKKFDFTKDNKFISYAVWWIKQSIQDYIKKSNISLSESQELFKVDDKNENNGYIIYNEYSDDEDISNNKEHLLNSLLECLSKRENDIIKSYYGIDNDEMTLDEIGKKYGLTKERVRQIKEKALIKLRSNALLMT